MFLHSIHTLTIRVYGQIEQSGDMSLFKKWWNVFPLRWFDVNKVVNDIALLLNSKADQILTYEAAKLKSYTRIQLLEALYIGMYALLKCKPANDQFVKSPKDRTNLIEYLRLTKDLVNIDITDLNGLARLQLEIQRQKDKYLERFTKKPTDKGESIPFIQYAFSVFTLLEMPYNPDMTMSEFGQLVKVGENKIKEIEKIKQRHGRK